MVRVSIRKTLYDLSVREFVRSLEDVFWLFAHIQA